MRVPMGSPLGARVVSDACPGCGRAVVSGGKFCRGCGRPFVEQSLRAYLQPAAALPVCGSCATLLVEHARFCHRCGATTAWKAPEKEPHADPKEDRTVVLGTSPAAQGPAQVEAVTRVLPRALAASPVVSSSESLKTDQVVTIVSRDPDDTPHAGTPGCSNCGVSVSGLWRFCRACGAPLVGPQAARPSGLVVVSSCPSCGGEVEDWAGFCRHCGRSLGNRADPSRGTPATGRTCEICGAPNAGGTGMCPDCGSAVAS